jgi:LCP family protein required for cell wall assembly
VLILAATVAMVLAAFVLALPLALPLLSIMHVPVLADVVASTPWILSLEERLGNLVAARDWSVAWSALLVVNVVAGLLRAWVALDAAASARSSRKPAAMSASRAALPERRARSTLAGRAASAAATLAAVGLVIVPHAGLAAGGLALAAVLNPVLVQRPPAVPPGTVVPAAASAIAESEALRPVWDGTSRLNVLLLGSDFRPQEASNSQWGNSDTILLISIDPGARGAAMISVPRDLYLPNIPGVGAEKINAAYREGGPALAVRVVSDLLAVPIHRWASVDVRAFQRIIDAVGGVIIDVERPIRDDEFPNEDYSVRRVFIPAGIQWLDGERAMFYARSRHSSTDFERANRQQRLLVELKARVASPGIAPRLSTLVSTLADTVRTDMSPREALALARMAASAQMASVRSLVLTPPAFGQEIIRPDLYAVQPDLPRIRAAVTTYLSAEAAGAVAASPAVVETLPLPPQGDVGEPVEEAADVG